MKRVVVTGMGAVTPLGSGIAENWEKLMAGKSGVRKIDAFDTSGICSHIAGIVPVGVGKGEFDLDGLFGRRDQSRNDKFILYTLEATRQALLDAGWEPSDEHERQRTSVVVGSGVGGFVTLENGTRDFDRAGQRGLTPFFVSAQVINLASGQICIRHGFKGADFGVVSACATGSESVATAARLIMLDEADVVVAGGADAPVDAMSIAGFCQTRALSAGYNDRPEVASRPFDRGRDGFVIAEGAGVLILEEYEHARARGAHIYAELAGYASVGDAFHITATSPDGEGEARAIRTCLDRAGLRPDEVDYLNAHATSTPVGDRGELSAMRQVFGRAPKVAISSTKSATGHTLGAAGAVAAIYSVLSIQNNAVPPTLNLEDPEEGYDDMNLVPNTAQERTVDVAVSNAFGFGATKVTLAFKRV
jgi:3-oxoacyl-[acyl-carrier-protein] synthase II